MAQKLKIGIVEDEVIIADDIRVALESLGYETPEPCSNYDQAIVMLEEQQPDLALLDIKLRRSKDGIELAAYIRERWDIPIIFLTANSDAVTLERAKAVKPNAFLVKPFQKIDLYMAIELAVGSHTISKKQITVNPTVGHYLANDVIFIKDGYYFHKVMFDDIIYMNSDHEYVAIHTTQKKFLVRTTLRDYLEKFDAKKFVRVHQRYVVNINKVEKINSAYLIINNEEIPISRTYYQLLLAKLNLG